MRNDKLIPGMILVMIGAAFLLHNFGYLHFHWENFAFLWPIFIVIGGVNLVLAGNRSAWATILKAAVIIGGFALILFGDFSGSRYHWWSHWGHYAYHSDDNDDDGDDNSDNSGNDVKMTNISGSSEFNEPYNASIKQAKLIISGGATTFRLNDTTNQLFQANTKQFHGKYSFTTHNEDSVYVMNLSLKEKKFWNWGDDNKANNAFISLNTRPIWDMEIQAGATDLDFDLSKYKMKNVDLSGGAGSFKIKMGQPLENTNVTVSTGASDVTIQIPNDAACHITTDSGLSSNTFDGFNKMGDGDYETSGFDSAKNKMYIHISGGVSDFKVHKY
ncbi:MAG TPA: DUF5668 domain-containing protein [Mucilaginibacter sp.]|nr:DUF5668 domain-containing protein [Mucilaginibacter sp.]